jgi:hypothetical protein
MKKVFPLLILGFLCLIAYRWDSFIVSSGTSAPGSISEKRETVRVYFADWFKRLEIVVAFRAPGYPYERHAVCDVDQETYDALHVGSPVTVHFLPALLGQPFLPSTRISVCPSLLMFASNSNLYRTFFYLIGSLALILVIAFVLRLRRATWLLVPWSAFFVVYGICPHAEPAPLQSRPAQAVVRNITTVDTIIEGGDTRSYSMPIKLAHPYHIVELQFTPAERSEPVVAVDAIDQDSLPNLKPGQFVNIEYDRANPRVVRIPGATRQFEHQALHQIGLEYGFALVVLLLLLLFAARSRRPRKGFAR